MIKLSKAQSDVIRDMRIGGSIFKMIGSANHTLKSSDGYNVPIQNKTYKTLVDAGLLNKFDNTLTELGMTLDL